MPEEHPAHNHEPEDQGQMLSLAILAGGRSRRMGQDKALVPFRGQPLILHTIGQVRSLSDDILVIANQPADYSFLDLPIFRDVVPGCGPLGGIFSALRNARHPLVAILGCDMPFASLPLFEYECELLRRTGADVIVPSSPQGLEPLHSIYRSAACLPAIQAALDQGERRIISWFPEVKVETVSAEETRKFSPGFQAFINLNTPDEFLQAMRDTSA